ncbi:hypothetical protein BDQ17DRAFT_1270187 [Cyathus striatus]|nr:hypothetical protein BDQ17DRAFT_1270187 [Cyathus striatus]
MSDSDEFGGLAPTTPVIKPKGTTARRTHKPDSQPGPSRSNARSGRKKAPAAQKDDSDIQEIEPVEDPAENDMDDIIHIHPSPPPNEESRAGSVGVNGKMATKNKGKAKAQPKPVKKPSKARPASEEEIEVMAESDGENIAEEIASTINIAMKGKRSGEIQTRSSAVNSRMSEQLKRAQAQIERMSQELEEALQIRETEAEAVRRQLEAQYQEQLREQHTLINELTSHLEKTKPLVGSGKSSILHLITREAADEEQQNLEKEKDHWKRLAKDGDKQLAAKVRETEELNQTIKEMTFELDIEKKRNQELATKAARQPPGSASRSQPRNVLGSDDPKHAQVIKFYEDLTNLLVPSIKAGKSKYFGLDEWIFTCVYTCPSSDGDAKSLNFTLRFCHEPEPGDASVPITSEDQLVESVQYIPLSLEREPPEFVKSLTFLASPFTFQQEQLSIFLKTLKDNICGPEADGDVSDGSSVQMVE